MATSSEEIVQELNRNKLTNTELNRKLEAGIVFHSQATVDLMLANGADPNALAIRKNGTESIYTPLTQAVLHTNFYAVKKLIKAKADFKINIDGSPLFFTAVQLGDPDTVKEFLTAGFPINTYDDMSALSATILAISAYSLIYGHASTWSDSTNNNVNDLQLRLENWYTTKNQDFLNNDLKVKYYGDLETISILLSNNIDIHKPDLDGITPLMLSSNPTEYVQEFLNANASSELKFLSSNNHTLTFEITLESRNYNKTTKVIVEYDFTRILSTLQAHIASQQAYNPISRKSIEGMVTQSEAKAIREIEALQTQVTPMYKAHKATADRAAKIAAIQKETNGQSTFFNALSHGLNNILLAFKTLESKMVKREQYATLDTCSDIMNLLSDHVPAPFGTATALLAAITQKISDMREENKHKRVTRRVELDHVPLCEDFALAITELYKSKLMLCTEANAEKLAKEAITAALILLNDDVAFVSTKPVVVQLVEAVRTSTQFNTQVNNLPQQPLVATKNKKKKIEQTCAMM